MPYSHFPTQRHNIEQRIVKRAWADPEYRARLLGDPKAALAEHLGVELPERFKVDVLEEQPDRLCIVLPVDTSGMPRPIARVMMGMAPNGQPQRQSTVQQSAVEVGAQSSVNAELSQLAVSCPLRASFPLAVSFPPGRGGLSPAQVSSLVDAFDEAKLVPGHIDADEGGHVVTDIRSGAIQWMGADLVGEEIFSHLYTLAVVANREQGWNFDLAGIPHFLQGTRYAAEGQEHYGWHMDWGPGVNQTRKIAVVAQLTDPGAYTGGVLQVTNGGVPANAMQQAGSVTVFPAFMMHRVTPVTEGVRFSLVAWVQGPLFS